MKEIITFLVDNWQPILSAFLLLVALILLIVKKKPTAYSYLDYAYSLFKLIPDFINKAESTGVTGSAKKNIVVNSLLHALKKLVVLNDEQVVYCKFIFSNAVESILSTPQKKGVK